MKAPVTIPRGPPKLILVIKIDSAVARIFLGKLALIRLWAAGTYPASPVPMKKRQMSRCVYVPTKAHAPVARLQKNVIIPSIYLRLHLSIR